VGFLRTGGSAKAVERSDFFLEVTRLGGGGPINSGDDNIPLFLVVEKRLEVLVHIYLHIPRYTCWLHKSKNILN
jgi:hypothetical protein